MMHIFLHFPEGVTVTCGKKEMQIDVEKKVLNGFKSSYLRLTERACRAQENETHFSLVAPLMSCGTVSRHTNDAVVYSNKVEEQEIGFEGMVSRMPELTIPFSCFYTKEGVTSTFGIIPRKVRFMESFPRTCFYCPSWSWDDWCLLLHPLPTVFLAFKSAGSGLPCSFLTNQQWVNPESFKEDWYGLLMPFVHLTVASLVSGF